MLVSGGASASRGVERCRGHPRIERCSAVPAELCDGEKGILFPNVAGNSPGGVLSFNWHAAHA